VVLGETLWRRSWGGDPAIVGSTIDVSGRSVRVVGIQGAGGAAPGGRAELWLPALMDPRDDDFWKARSLTLVGVLRPGADMGDAFDDLAAFNDRLSQLFPMFYPAGFAEGRATVARADEAQRRMISTPLLLLFGGTALLLLVTALNVGNLLLGRAVHRRRELAIRTALGAGRRRIVGQLLVEGTTLTALALGVGLIGGSVGGRWVAALFVGEAVVARSSVLSPSVLAFSLAVSALAWLVLNGVPVAHFIRTQKGGPAFVTGVGTGAQRTLVAVQSALATLLLVSATLLVATVGNLRRVPLGFDTRNLLAVELSPPEDRVGSVAQARMLYDRLVERAAALPGVRSAGLAGWLPLRAQAPTTPINLEVAPVDPAQAPQVPMHMVDAGFFEALGIEASAGRLLGSEDRDPEPSAVVVNRTLADVLWPNGSAVGQRIAIDPHAWDRWVPVVGVVPDVRSGGITGPTGPALYVSLAESPARDVTLLVRTTGDPAGSIPALRRLVTDVDPLVPVRAVTRMGDVVRAAYSTSWVMMGLLLVLAGLATALGATGIYGVLAHHVVVNRRTIGVRMALGAHPRVVVGSVVRSGLTLAWIGIAVGSLTALWSTTLLDSLLFEVTPLAPWAYLAPAAALSVAAALAAWIPASRAGRLLPAEVLRSE
jgi:putative ABC transport system permease protein